MSKSILTPKERDVQKAVMDYLGTQGFVIFRRNTGAMQVGKRFVRFSEPGMADLYGWDKKTGRHIEVEVKRPREKPTPAQSAWLSAAQQTGAVAFWCDSVDDCRRALLAEFMGREVRG